MKIVAIFVSFFLLQVVFAQNEDFTSYYEYQNAVYAQERDEYELELLYSQAQQDISVSNTPPETSLMLLASLEELHIRTILRSENTKDAFQILEKGIALAEQSVEKKKTAQGYAVLSSLYSIGTKIKPSALLSMGLKSQDMAKKAFKIDPQNAAAVHLVAAGQVYAPVPFRNIKKGIEMMQEYLNKPHTSVTKADLFNLTVCVAHGYYLLNDQENANVWFEKAATIFPNNSALNERSF